jgi:hypothetical protein
MMTDRNDPLFGSPTGAEALSAMAAVAAAAAQPMNQAVALQADNATDVDLLNFALNLEYLESEYYLRGVFGQTLDQVFRTPLGGPVRGGRKLQFTTRARDGMLRNIAGNEVQHVAFLRAINGANAIQRPPIDFEAGFAGVARAAGIPDFDPFANEMNFFLGAMLFEDVGITAFKNAAKLIRSRQLLETAAGLLASEGYHMGAVRSVIYKLGEPARARSIALSELRDRLDGPQDLDQPVVQIGQMSNVVPSNGNGIAFGRTPQHALNILYNNPAQAVMAGGFFPQGVNGRIRST